MKSRILLFIVLLSSTMVFAQKRVAFNEKRILKFLQKKFEMEGLNIKETQFSSHSILYYGVNGDFYEINKHTKRIGLLYIGRVNSCRNGGCSLTNKESSSFEYFDYLVAFNNKLEVQTVKVFNYQATHGHEICARSWLKQFNGYNGEDDLLVGKNIDAIAGATISVNAITEDIKFVTKELNKEL